MIIPVKRNAQGPATTNMAANTVMATDSFHPVYFCISSNAVVNQAPTSILAMNESMVSEEEDDDDNDDFIPVAEDGDDDTAVKDDIPVTSRKACG